MSPDMRKWTERRTALYSFWLNFGSIICSLIVSVIFGIVTYNISTNAHDLNQKTFCTNLVMPKLDALNDKLINLPVSLSGCAKRPREFCDRARMQFEQTRDTLLHLTGSLESSSVQLNQILETINSLDPILSGPLDGHQKEMIMIAGTLSRQKRNLGFIKPINLKCIDNSN